MKSCVGNFLAGLIFISATLVSGAKDGKCIKQECRLINSWKHGKHYMIGKVNVTVLKGSYRDMGRQYGALLKDKIKFMYESVIEKPMLKGGVTDFNTLKKEVVDVAWSGLARPQRELLRGMAETSGMSLDQVVLLDQSVTAAILYVSKAFGPHGFGACSCIAAWGNYSTDGKTVVGRNFDWMNLFLRCAPAFGVVVFQPIDGRIQTAVVGYAGWINALSGMNEKGLFLETNSGLGSAGIKVYSNRSPYLNELLNLLFDSENLASMRKRLMAIRPNAGILVNISNSKEDFCYENDCVDTRVRKATVPGLLVTANEFRLESWGLPIRESGSHSVRRWNNLCTLGNKYKGKINPQIMMKILDEPLHLGDGKFGKGATKSKLEPNDEDVTVHQIVAVPGRCHLWLKVPGYIEWTFVDLNKFFSTQK